MQEILAKRTNGNKAEVAPPDAIPSGPVVSGSLPNTLTADGAGSHLPVSSLEWGRPILTGVEAGTDAAVILSVCGRYSVSRDISDGRKSYSAWRRLPDLPGSNGRPYKQLGVPLGCVDSGEAAKALCAADAALHGSP